MSTPTARSFLLVLFLALLAGATPAGAQKTARVINDRIEPEWIDAHHCWFRLEHADGGSEFITIDARSGARTPLFDHALLAKGLGALLNRDIAPTRLPIDYLDVMDDGYRMIVRGGPGLIIADRTTLTLRAASVEDLRSVGRTLLPNPGNSRNGGPETELVIHNASDRPIELLWRDAGGNERSYGEVAPGVTQRQHTFAGHTWMFRIKDGETLGGIRAEARTNIIYLDGSPADRAPRPGARGNRAPRPANAVRPADQPYTASIREHNIVVQNRNTNEEHTLTTDGSEGDRYENRFFFSPDGKHLVAMKRKEGGDRKVFYVESSPRDQLQPKLHSYDYLKPGDPIPQSFPHLFDLDTMREIPIDRALFDNPWSINDLAWMPDSSRFLFTYNQRGHQAMRVLAVDATTGDVTPIINEEPATFFDYSNKTFRYDLLESNEIIWMSERSGWNHLYLIDATTGAVKNAITAGEWLVRGVDRVDPETRTIEFRALGIHPDQDPYHVHFARINFDGSNLAILTEGDGTHDITPSPEGEYYLDRYSRVDLPPITELRRTSDGERITTLAEAEVIDAPNANQPHRTPTRFVAKGRDRTTDIWGIIHWPRDYDPNDMTKKYPVIESIYAGPHGAHVPKSFRLGYGQNELTDLGFIVVQIDGMGTNWRSKAFHDECWKNIGDAGFPDRILWMQAAAKQYPAMDLSRVGIYGGSAGGQNAMRALIAHHDFYKVAVADCGCHDNRMDKIWWNEAWMGYPVGPEYEASSNVAHADRMQGELLLIVGEKDENVDPASTLQVVDALIRAEKDFDFLMIPGAGHGAAESPYGRMRRRAFFVEHLLE